VKRMIRVLAVAVLVAVILVASISPALAVRRAGGVLMPTTTPCDAHPETKNDKAPHFEFRDTPARDGTTPSCWMVLPNHDG
jgi:hypothetical protein